MKQTAEVKSKASEVKSKTSDVKSKLKQIPEDKQKLIDKFAQKKGDTGSPEVQTALLTLKINRLTQHLNQNNKDNHSRRGLLKIIAKRRRILNYLQKLDEKRYKELIAALGLKK